MRDPLPPFVKGQPAATSPVVTLVPLSGEENYPPCPGVLGAVCVTYVDGFREAGNEIARQETLKKISRPRIRRSGRRRRANACPDKEWYPKTRGDTYPNCFHASSTMNLHFHGSHASPDGFADNVLVHVRPDPKITEDQVRRSSIRSSRTARSTGAPHRSFCQEAGLHPDPLCRLHRQLRAALPHPGARGPGNDATGAGGGRQDHDRASLRNENGPRASRAVQ